MPPATENAEYNQLTDAECQQKNRKSADHMTEQCRQHSAFDFYDSREQTYFLLSTCT